MRRPVTLVTGAGGEIGHGLITRLAQARPADRHRRHRAARSVARPRLAFREFTGSITDPNLLERILAEFEVDLVVHLAALLSTRAEFTPITAHHVNVEGTLNLLEFAQHEGESHGRPVTFLYPSSIAAYGLPDVETKMRAGRVHEDEWNTPRTMYGCNKLYCEHLGRYYARFYKQLAAQPTGCVDFRCVRFPGLISAVTVPSGGTSDYAPEMIHAAARGEPLRLLRAARHAHSVHGDARRDRRAAAARRRAARGADAHRLQPDAPSVPTAQEIHDVVTAAFPHASHGLADRRQAAGDRRLVAGGRGRQRRAARLGLRAGIRFRARVFDEYLIPTIRERY